MFCRVGWEVNGSHSWKLPEYSAATISNYKYIFRTLVNLLRAYVPNVQIEWNPLRKGKQPNIPVTALYPGDDVVDVVSICIYDRLPANNTIEIWNQQFNAVKNGGPWGINKWREFAVSRGKLFAIPEWGLANGLDPDSKDNPLFISQMYNFFRLYANNLAYEAYFNAGSHAQLCSVLRSPKGSAAYRTIYQRI